MKRLIILFALVFVVGCTAKDELAQTGVKSLSWLEGRWMAEDENGKFIEEWQNAGLLLTGQGKMIHGMDTTNMERLTIASDTNGLAYIVDLPDREVRFHSRKQSSSATFKHLRYTETSLVTFASDTNDFPREITYRKQNADSLYITLTGSEAGKPMEMIFKMKKIK
jgi:hypothetical protein